MNHHFDVAIIGAGPAGWSAALTLRKAGRSVLIVDQSSFPRDKVCGGFLGFENKAFLEEWGIWSELRKRGAREIASIRLASSKSDLLWCGTGRYSTVALGVSRRIFDDVLCHTACERGVIFQDATHVSERKRVEQGWMLKLMRRRDHRDSVVTARRVIDATGALKVKAPHPKDLIGAYALFEGVNVPADEVGLYFSPGGHTGVNPFEGGLTNVCYVASRKTFEEQGRSLTRLFEYFQRSNPLLKNILSSAKVETPWKAVTVPRRPPFRFLEDGVFCVGDASAVIHPVVGGGMTLAVSGGCLLGQLMAESSANVSDEMIAHIYQDQFLKMFGSRLRSSWWLGELSHRKGVSDFVVSAGVVGQKFLQSVFKLNHTPSNLQIGQTS